MDKFLERYNLPRLNQEEIENMNRPITSTEIETVTLKLQTNKSPWLDGFTREFYQTFWEELTPILLNLFQKIAEERTSTNSFWYQNHHPDTKTRQRYHTHIQKLQTNTNDEHRCKNPQQNTSKRNPTIHSKDQKPWSSGIYPRDARIFQYLQINQCDTPH